MARAADRRVAQSSIFEALANIPSTAHILGGAVIGEDAGHGVVDHRQRVFGYENQLVRDGAANARQSRRQPEPHDRGSGGARDESRRAGRTPHHGHPKPDQYSTVKDRRT
jgi:hypothetical protein